MFRPYYLVSATFRTTTIRKNFTRFVSFLKIKDTLKNVLGIGSSEQPYHHICQIGDPVLRRRTIPIEPETIKLASFQKVIKHLINVMRSYDTCGLAGPQIGLPWQIFAMELAEKDLNQTHEVLRKVYEMEIIPTQVFINPKLKIIDHTPVAFHESCGSVRGYSAVVPRAYEIEITALNTFAEPFTWKARGWSARIAQHEYDHLQGTLYIDKMDINTFHCAIWEKINEYGGKVQIKYSPQLK